MVQKDEMDNVDFKWGIKRGRGGIKKAIQFYESFTYDGEEYFLYDSVYLFQDGASDPHIGKLIEIWELPNKLKKVKVLWFFRPSEISKYLGDLKALENELFLATGDGKGHANVNPLENSKWFTCLPWKDEMKAAQGEGTLVLLQNLDPAYTSAEVEDVVWHSFHENCTAKVIQHTAISSPYSGRAFVIFKTKQAAERIVRELKQGCLVLPNGRPLLSQVELSHVEGKPSSFPGHLMIDRLKFETQKDKREAVSTSHCSKPNTLEYDMAMEWRILQDRSDLMWRNLFKQQREELMRLRRNLKRK